MTSFGSFRPALRKLPVLFLAAAAVLAGVRPLFQQAESTRGPGRAECTEWPLTFEGETIFAVPLHPAEEKLSARFPGNVAAFTDGYRRIVMRHLTQPTRRLHPAGDCLRAAGFSVRPAPAVRRGDSGLWGAVFAEKDGRRWLARERIVSADGSRVWTDVSAWFWSALLRPAEGPWLAITVIEPRGQGELASSPTPMS